MLKPRFLNPSKPDARDRQRMNVARRQLLDALGVDPANLPVRERAALEALAEEVLDLRNELIEKDDELVQARALADSDVLCPVFNRRAFVRELTPEIALARRHGFALCMIYMDLDLFKLVNDKFGHSEGDRILKKAAALLTDNVRQSDIVGRLGGDEFGAILPYAALKDARTKALELESLLDGLKASGTEDGKEPIKVGGSCGTVEWNGDETAAQMIARADASMFRAKAVRRACSSRNRA